MSIYIILALVVLAAVIFTLTRKSKDNNIMVLHAAEPAVQNSPKLDLTEEELAVIAAAIKAFESEAFEITSITEVGNTEEAANERNSSVPVKAQTFQSSWKQAARREYQRKL